MKQLKEYINSRIALLEELLSTHSKASLKEGKRPSEDIICCRFEAKIQELRIILKYLERR